MSEPLTTEPIKPAEELFADLQSLRALREHARVTAAQGTVSIGDLGRWLFWPGNERDALVEAALKTDMRLYAAYKLLRDTKTRVVIPKAALASDEQILERRCEGFAISWKASKADTSQCYVIVMCEPSCGIKEGEKINLLFDKGLPGTDRGVESVRLSFPVLSAGRTSILLEAQHPVFACLLDDDCEIRLIEITA
jgi:hypothetical protein